MGPHWKLINIGSGNGLLPDRTKPLSDSILSGPQWVDWSKVCWNKSSSYLLEFINPCRVEFILRKNKIDICISSQFSTLISRSMLVGDINLVILHIQYKLCWWPGDASTRVLAYFFPEYSGFSIKNVKRTPWFNSSLSRPKWRQLPPESF